jgi:hypothetical protein
MRQQLMDFSRLTICLAPLFVGVAVAEKISHDDRGTDETKTDFQSVVDVSI